MPTLPPERAADLSAAALARAFLVGDADPVAVAEECLRRSAAFAEPVFVTLTADRARAEAQAAAARIADGRPASPLDGVPVAVKDLFDAKGTVTTAASALWQDNPAAETDAPVLAHLAAAGMVLIGKTNLTEFAYSGLGLNPHFGTPANPLDTETRRVPGGSSAGSAVAVAARLVPAAIGSDTGGSVRVPAAFNGLVGYKSSERRVPIGGAIPLSYTLDTVGPLAHTVEDCILIDAALRGRSAHVHRPLPREISILVAETLFLDDCEPAVTEAFEAAVRRLETGGVRVRSAPVPELAEAARVMADHGTLAAAEAYHYHRERVDGPERERMDARVVARIMKGKAMSAHDVIVILRARARLVRTLADRLGGALLAGPTVAHVAPEIAPLEADPDLFNTMNLKTLRNTMVGNFLNLPGVAIPMASPSPLPVSFLVSALPDGDDALLGAALAIEETVRSR